MTAISTTCTDCDRSIGADPSKVRALAWADGACYWLACPHCGSHVTRPASETTVALLVSAGVTLERAAVEQGSGPAITEDDLISFGRGIEALPCGVPVIA